MNARGKFNNSNFKEMEYLKNCLSFLKKERLY